MSFFDCHAHSEYSNIRLIDCINHPKELIDKAIELGLSGIAITDHESLSAHMIVNKYAKKLQETNPDFKIALGNEIYLTDTRDMGQKYYHFVVLAKDAIGYQALRELSSTAWYNCYYDRRMERVPTLKSELREVMKKYKGHLIGSTACLGGELGTSVLNLVSCEAVNDNENAQRYHNQIVNFMEFCIEVFGKDDFYVELSPAESYEQIIANIRMVNVAKAFGVKHSIGCDAHFLRPEDRYVHKAYLNSKGGEREVDSFYEYCYLHNEEELRKGFAAANFTDPFIDELIQSSNEIAGKIEFYSLETHQSITEVEVKDYPKSAWWGVNNSDADEMSKYPTLKSLFISDNLQERYWVNECWNALQEKKGYWADNLAYVERLEEEARVKRVIGEKLNTCMFAYPNTLKHYVDLFWECGSIVGAGRGSSCSGLNHYLLGITQLDPLTHNFPFWRYLNDERLELGDIDIDLAPSKIQDIFAAIRQERGELGLVQVATFGTEKTKSGILTACRGYRSEEYPEGIDVDIAQYMSSLVPSERGFLWPINDVVNGNEEKDRKPVKPFIQEVNKYPGLLDIIIRIEGMVKSRGTHASGVILLDGNNPYEHTALMRSPAGAICTQWDLHDAEAGGLVKYDFLVTSVQDIIIQTLKFLQEDNVIDPSLTLREAYNQYLHPERLPQTDEMWKALEDNSVIGCFQFDSADGIKAAKKIKPRTLQELADANSLMRLMTGDGGENPIDKYVRYKRDIGLWYREMDVAGLTKQEQRVLEPYFLQSYGVPPSQEQLMMMLQDPLICGFSLSEANSARKTVGKKLMDKIPELHEQILSKASSQALGDYIWKCGVGPQLGYSFSIIHATAYSYIGLQTLYLATAFDPIYWNTAYLVVNSGSLDADSDDNSNYTKMAKAIGEIRSAGIKMSLVDINKSDFGFKPDVKNNQILFGLKGLINVNNDLIKTIIDNRPYSSLVDFMNKVGAGKQAMIALVKGGAFDQFVSRREEAMVQYIWLTCDKKKRITLQNLPGLIKYDLIPTNSDLVEGRKIYEFNRYLKNECKYGGEVYRLDDRAIDFLNSHDFPIEVEFKDSFATIGQKAWDKIYQKEMDVFRNWIASDKEGILDTLNTTIFMEDWNKYAQGTISAWEMEALCFYYHEHELANVNKYKYGFANFEKLPETPVVDKILHKGNAAIPIYKLNLICGTCIAKNKTKSTVYLLTTGGVVAVKFRQEHFSLFDKQVSQRNADGSKKVIEKSWFNRGNMIVVQGIRRGDEFITKKYSNSGHQLYHIDEILDNGDIILRSERKAGEEEEDYE